MSATAYPEIDRLAELVRARELASSGAARLARQRAGLSLREVGAVVGRDPATILRWERGEQRPRGDAAIRYGAVIRELLSPDKARAAA